MMVFFWFEYDYVFFGFFLLELESIKFIFGLIGLVKRFWILKRLWIDVKIIKDYRILKVGLFFYCDNNKMMEINKIMRINKKGKIIVYKWYVC